MIEEREKLNIWKDPLRRYYFKITRERQQTKPAFGHETNFSSVCLLWICFADNDL